MSVRSRAQHDDNGPDIKPMHDMDAGTLSYCEELYAWGHEFDSTGRSRPPVHVLNGKINLKNKLTGEYVDPRTGGRVQYMMYNIPRLASPGLRGYMEDLKEKYEASYPNKRSRSDVDDSHDSISFNKQARIMELRKLIEENERNIIKWKAELASLGAAHT